jgi:alkanesulfonate monooxygenase SsuD/methylene tetrahydromethanopterin reductase-like flavin-dependent oxidoreductase (luciferase family)
VPFGARARMTDEFVEAMRAIWTQPLASYSGRYVSFTDAEIFPKPLQKPGPRCG